MEFGTVSLKEVQKMNVNGGKLKKHVKESMNKTYNTTWTVEIEKKKESPNKNDKKHNGRKKMVLKYKGKLVNDVNHSKQENLKIECRTLL